LCALQTISLSVLDAATTGTEAGRFVGFSVV
jgi:hypothetical protein